MSDNEQSETRERSRSRSRSRSRERKEKPAENVQEEEEAKTTAPKVDRNNVDGKLYIGNLSYSASVDMLREAFEKHGEVIDVYIPLDKHTNRPRGFGFVKFASEADASSSPTRTKSTKQMLNGARSLPGGKAFGRTYCCVHTVYHS